MLRHLNDCAHQTFCVVGHFESHNSMGDKNRAGYEGSLIKMIHYQAAELRNSLLTRLSG